MAAQFTDDKHPIPDVPIKTVDFRAATHKDLLTVCNVVLEKDKKWQTEEFNAIFQAQQKELVERLAKEKKMELDNLKSEHKLHIEKLQQQNLEMMNEELKAEADKMKDLMHKSIALTIEDGKLEGQKQLDESLKEACMSFEKERSETMRRVIMEHKMLQVLKAQQLKVGYDKEIEKLEAEWNEKLNMQAEKASAHEKETLDRELEITRKKFNVRLEEALLEANKKHTQEENELKKCLENEQLNGASLRKEIQHLNSSIAKLKTDLEKSLQSFQNFIEGTPGFNAGQSGFILDHLLSNGFDEFTSSSD